VENLSTWFKTSAGTARAVDGVSLTLRPGKTLCIVGESGCGKSVTALSIMGLVPRPGKVVKGAIRFRGKNLIEMSDRQLAQVRGNQISMIFQDPSAALNPVQTVGEQIAEVFVLHKNMSGKQAYAAAVDMLRATGIPDPEQRMRAYPHEMSGGMAQRVMIAMALACQPVVLIADEPTTALDVTIQAQILDLMRDLQETLETATILITHDLGIVAEMAHSVAVMYAGEIVEFADVRALFRNPQHPYTKALLRSIPVIGEVQETLEVIEGRVPNMTHLPPACRFAPRCHERKESGDTRCEAEAPGLVDLGDGHLCRCWRREAKTQ
ncbi:MAG: ABC transporter ATP-binding protein, partial [Alphaproteobacteria bacterium]